MEYIGFIGIVLVVTAFIGTHIYVKKHPTEDINYDKSGDYKPIFPKQPKVYTTDCNVCVWRSAETCKECPVTKNRTEVTLERLQELKVTLKSKNAVPKVDPNPFACDMKCTECIWKDCC